MYTFMGYPRPDGKVGIRNHVVIMPSVACVNGTADRIGKMVPGTVPILHGHGCGRLGEDAEMHTRVLANLCKNPNVAAVLIVGLGCEVIKGESLYNLVKESGKPVEFVNVQTDGGTLKTAEKGAEYARKMLEYASSLEKQPFGIDKITLGLECGGSDALSGVTANPATGYVSDWVIENGGTTILTETTEMIGTAHILKRRAVNPELGQEIEDMVNRQEKQAEKILGEGAKAIISPGNMDGGMSSIREKSLGSICKAGKSTIQGLVKYGEVINGKGLYLMDGPGYDVDSITGEVASGATIMIFTTGRGNPVGFPICPVIKVASNSKLYSAMEDDMDVNAGRIVEGVSLEEMGEEMVELLKQIIEGEQTKAEKNQQDNCIGIYTTSQAF